MQPICPDNPSPQPSVHLGDRRAWGRDLALVGAVTTLSLGAVSPLPVATVLVAAALAAVGGALLGALVPVLLGPRVRTKPVVALLAAGIGLGACWLGASGTAAALVTDGPWIWTAQICATAGAVQLGWLWLPMVLAHRDRAPTLEYVLLACLGAPLVGYLAYQHVVF